MSEEVNENKENNSEQDKSQKRNLKEKISDVLIWAATIFGIGAVILAGVMPFLVKNYYAPRIEDYEFIGDLGAVGDFIGGTTVAILTSASVFLLLATIIMQRKEIKISQEGIKQLVIQTEASVEQAEEARKEAIVTNETMARQQFESTFFNMINLQRNLIDRLKYEKTEGYLVIEESLKSLYEHYIKVTHENFKQRFLWDESEEVEYLIYILQMRRYNPAMLIKASNDDVNREFFRKLDFRNVLIYKEDSSIIREYEEFALINNNSELIQRSFFKFMGEYGSILNSYFNNFATILNFLHESIYESEDIINNTEENKIYREILFSQLSPDEMLLIYYYARYHNRDGQMIDKLKTYNLFYPRLLKYDFLFEKTDSEEIWNLSKE